MKSHFNWRTKPQYYPASAAHLFGDQGRIQKFSAIAFVFVLMGLGVGSISAAESPNSTPTIRGLTGSVHDISVSVPAAERIAPVAASQPDSDIDPKLMAKWAMNYLIETPRAEFDYEPVFQCWPRRRPPIPAGRDPIVPCDTDARMDWEWYYMRDVSASTEGKDVEAAFHKRIRSYIDSDGVVRASPGAFHEDKPTVRRQSSEQ
jgi:hypothetical protein